MAVAAVEANAGEEAVEVALETTLAVEWVAAAVEVEVAAAAEAEAAAAQRWRRRRPLR